MRAHVHIMSRLSLLLLSDENIIDNLNLCFEQVTVVTFSYNRGYLIEVV